MQALASRALAARITVALALALSGNAAAQVAVSQFYSSAGTISGGYLADFIELHNNSDAAVTKHGFADGDELGF